MDSDQHIRNKPNIVLNDIIHGSISLPHICKKIINTPEFQRLRDLKQLGLGYWVYPSASHNRFEHCIGTAYLAEKYITILRDRQPDREITKQDMLCVTIAGLCHDLGHGPFSHSWENFIEAVEGNEFSHEEMSKKLFQNIYETLKKDFAEAGLNEYDVIFIKGLITGKPDEEAMEDEELVKRRTSKYFLYQIVSNDETGIDVDKFDYLLRDCMQLNLRTTFDYQRIIHNSCLMKDPINKGRFIITYRKKIIDNIEDLFSGRFRMHQAAYQHRVTIIIEQMMIHALQKANSHLKLTFEEFKLSNAHTNPHAFMELSDSIIDVIKHDRVESLEMIKAKDIIMNIRKRDLYVCFGYIENPIGDEKVDEFKRIDPNLIEVKSVIKDGKKDTFNLFVYDKVEESSSFNEDTLESFTLSSPKCQHKSYIILKKPRSLVNDEDYQKIKQKLKKFFNETNDEILTT